MKFLFVVEESFYVVCLVLANLSRLMRFLQDF
jgi:hypothetical protein